MVPPAQDFFPVVVAEGAVLEDPTPQPLSAVLCRRNYRICPQQLQRVPPNSGMMGSGDSVTSIITSSDASLSDCPVSPYEAAPLSHVFGVCLLPLKSFLRDRDQKHYLG